MSMGKGNCRKHKGITIVESPCQSDEGVKLVTAKGVNPTKERKRKAIKKDKVHVTKAKNEERQGTKRKRSDKPRARDRAFKKTKESTTTNKRRRRE